MTFTVYMWKYIEVRENDGNMGNVIQNFEPMIHIFSQFWIFSFLYPIDWDLTRSQ